MGRMAGPIAWGGKEGWAYSSWLLSSHSLETALQATAPVLSNCCLQEAEMDNWKEAWPARGDFLEECPG